MFAGATGRTAAA